MNKKKDYYAILGVLPKAEDVVIRAAYKALALRYHPDRFEGDPGTANQKMSEISEAYAVLSDAGKRKNYDSLRDSDAGDSYFGSESDDPQPNYDPLERDWSVAVKYYPDLQSLDSKLAKIAWRLAYSYRAYILAEKKFDSRKQVADEMQKKFLELYFGTNPKIVSFACELIEAGNKRAAKALNEAARILGSSINPDRIIGQIRNEFMSSAPESDLVLMNRYGITYDGGQYQYNNYRYDKLSDAVNYAIQHQKTTAFFGL
jgi:curved DNA-binding protein CbpA